MRIGRKGIFSSLYMVVTDDKFMLYDIMQSLGLARSRHVQTIKVYSKYNSKYHIVFIRVFNHAERKFFAAVKMQDIRMNIVGYTDFRKTVDEIFESFYNRTLK